MSEENLAFPYTDDFRRAKRNSLLWSGITLVAAVGSPPVAGGESTFGHLGFSLTYDKSVIIGVAGLVAIFMAIGFWQALSRIRLHANQLFAGETDVEQVFRQLSAKAAATIARLQTINDELPLIAARATGRENVSEKLEKLKLSVTLDAPYADVEKVLNFPGTPNDIGRLPQGDLKAFFSGVRTILTQRRQIEGEIVSGVARLDEMFINIRSDMSNCIQKITSEIADNVRGEETEMTKQVSQLMRFHQGLYRSEIRWFWGFDVAPVAVLFLLAMWEFLRLFV